MPSRPGARSPHRGARAAPRGGRDHRQPAESPRRRGGI